jgi:hypothetical protein
MPQSNVADWGMCEARLLPARSRKNRQGAGGCGAGKVTRFEPLMNGLLVSGP